jgi:hypothetical protein
MRNSIEYGQALALNRLVEQFTGKDRAMRLWVISELAGRAITSTDSLTRSEWQTIRDMAYPDWHNDNWAIADSFAGHMAVLVNRYREEVLGQLRMF